MYPQTDVYFYKLRSLFIGIAVIGFLVIISALITAIGSGTALNPRSHASVREVDTSMYDTSNSVTAGAYNLIHGTERGMLSVGTVLYEGCDAITTATAQSGKAIAHGSAAVLHAVGSTSSFVLHGIGTGIMFTLRLPEKLVAPIASGYAVSVLIKPSDTKTVPVISSETSAAALVHLSAQQQQQIASLQAAQLAANHNLGGAVVAGDSQHGGYPASWDATAQDSRLDSWGMYNRECVSYAAWKVYQTYGTMPYWGGVGNANQWVRDARNAGIATGLTPQVHSVAISMRGYYGHAMWVEAVNGDRVYVSQYNYDLQGHYSEMWISSSSLTYIYFK